MTMYEKFYAHLTAIREIVEDCQDEETIEDIARDIESLADEVNGKLPD